jgi:hypothetical protein
MTYIPTDVEIERRNRIRLSLFAYAYEYEDDPLISDAEYDKLSYLIQKDMATGNKTLDRFFNRQFAPHTGQWIHKHPELDKLKALYFMAKNSDGPYIRFGKMVLDIEKKAVVKL